MDTANHSTPGAGSNGSRASNEKLAPDLERGPTGMPRIPINLYDHKIAIAIRWTILLICSCFLPVGMYFILKYAAHAKGSVGKVSIP